MHLSRTRYAQGDRSQVRGDDRGMTLVEVLITVVVMGMIMLPLGNAVIGFINLTDDTSRRLNESRDIQIAAAYFAQDVQAVGTRDWTSWPYPLQQSVEPGALAASGLYPCGNPGTPAAVVRFAWDDPETVAAAPTVIRVSYVVVVVGTERQLHRITCVGSAAPTSDLILAHNIDPIAPVLTCSTACTAAPGVPASVTLTLTIRVAGSVDPPLVVNLVGQRRQT